MRCFNIIFVDDEKANTQIVTDAVKKEIGGVGSFELNFSVLDKKSEIDKLPELSADIVLFDCAMGVTASEFNAEAPHRYGFELIKAFRRNNKRAIIVFYSGNFSLEGPFCYEFTHEEMLELINEMHIYKMIPKKVEYITQSIKEAIRDLDSVILTMQNLRDDYEEHGIVVVDDNEYTIDQMINELKNETVIGEQFRENINKLLLTYMMKFRGDID